MALRPCWECGAKISSRAAACPQCGAPPTAPAKESRAAKKGMGCGGALVLGVIGLVVAGMAMNRDGGGKQGAQVEREAEARAKRARDARLERDARIKREFGEKLAAHYDQLVDLIDKEQWSKAARLAGEFAKHGHRDHRDVEALGLRARSAVLRLRLEALPDTDIEGRFRIYLDLEKLHPQDEELLASKDEVHQKLIAQRAKLREQQALDRAAAKAPRTSQRPPTPGISADVSYTVITTSRVPGIKRGYNIRLNRKVTEQTLRAIALRLKSKDTRAYERTLIHYYLPGMTVGAGAWATTNFDPGLKVTILGLTEVETQKLAKEPVPTNGEIVGRWLDEVLLGGIRIALFREGRKLFVEEVYKDGSRRRQAVTQRESPLGTRLDPLTASRTGDHWVLLPSGDLQSRDHEGLISTARKIE